MTFYHLHNHSDRSIMRGMIKPKQLVEWSVQHGLTAAAFTDYSNMNVAASLYKECNAAGIKPIYGMEVNVVEDKGAKAKEARRLVLLAKNEAGFKNLVKLATTGCMYFYYQPRVDWSDLESYSEGLIALTGDMQGVAAYAYFANQEEGLVQLGNKLSAIYGKDYLWELEPVPTDSQRILNEALVKFALDSGHGLVATGDCHYMTPHDTSLHEHVVAIKNCRNPAWVYPYKGPYHVRDKEEMVEQFASLHGYDVSYVPGFKEAFENPERIANEIESFDLRSGVKIPSYVG